MWRRVVMAAALAATVSVHAALVIGAGFGLANGSYEPGPAQAPAASVYYTVPHMALGYLNEGVIYGADGVFVQARAIAAVTPRMQVAAAIGPAVLNMPASSGYGPTARWSDHYVPSVLVSLSASYRVAKSWRLGLKWEHDAWARQPYIRGYADADVVLFTIGYGG